MKPVRLQTNDREIDQSLSEEEEGSMDAQKQSENAQDYVDAARENMEYLDIPAFLRRQAD